MVTPTLPHKLKKLNMLASGEGSADVGELFFVISM